MDTEVDNLQTEKIRFAGISGSLRAGSLNTKLLRSASRLLPENTEMEIVEIGTLPLYNSDLEGDSLPLSVLKFRESLGRADALVLVSPEYNYSIPGTLKNAIDWASRGKDSPIFGKAVALMGATMGKWGTARMQLAFRPVFQCLDMTPVNKPEVLVAEAADKFDESGHLRDETTEALIRRQLRALKTLVVNSRKLKEEEHLINS